MQTEHFNYQVENKNFNATVHFNEDWDKPRPAILIYHAFEGMNDVMTDHAQLVVEEMGFVAVTIDVYGDGYVANDLDDCLKHCMALIEDRDTLNKRLLASVAAAKDHEKVDSQNMCAIGFCFGGLCVLDLARAGADINGVVSAHGVLAPNPHHSGKNITAKVLVCHGYNDPQIPHEQISGFMTEMNDAKADWQFITYGNTKHAFTDPHASKIGGPEMGREFNRLTTERMWRLAREFFHECFKD